MRVLALSLILLSALTFPAFGAGSFDYMDDTIRQYGMDPDGELKWEDFRKMNKSSRPESARDSKKQRYTRSDYRQVVDFLVQHQIDPAALSEAELNKAFLRDK